MRGALRLLAGIVVVVGALPAWGGPAGDNHAGWTGGSGSYVVTFNIQMAQPMPAGGAILCRAHLAPNLGMAAGTWATETATGVATVRGGTAQCTVEIPFRWEGNGAGGSFSAALHYEIDAVSGTGERAYQVRAQLGMGVELPAGNGKESLQICLLF